QAAGLAIRVLCFGAQRSYEFEGIQVLSESDWRAKPQPADVLISHAPNLRNHLRFLLGPGQRFRRWIFFFHGHEVLLKQAFYPKPYAYTQRQNPVVDLADRGYDRLKLWLWRQLIRRWLVQMRLKLVFVSEWMRQAFNHCVGLDPALSEIHGLIIPNAVHPEFLAGSWQAQPPFAADFVTIRPLDNPKYAIDQVSQLALAHPNLRFDVFGRGSYFRHYPPPANLNWIDQFLTPQEMVSVLGRYRAALMPTRLDAQGVMMCELASFDMPLLTSDLPICREMLAGFPRVAYLPSQLEQADLNALLAEIEAAPSAPERSRFAPAHTIAQELALIQSWHLTA
ncbi:MAG: hypothetical protein CVV27_14835, partial [Candidatus Melainabacteria bacterium HGW-Melainabacteria-1]